MTLLKDSYGWWRRTSRGAQGLEEPVRLGGQVDLHGREGPVLEFRPVDEAVDGADAVQVDRAIGGVDAVLVDLELGHEEAHQALRRLLLDLETHHVALAPFLEGLGDLLEEVVGFLLVDVELGVAGDAEGAVAGHAVALEEILEVVGDDPGQGHHVHGAVVPVGQGQDPRQHPRHGDHAHGGLAVLLQKDADAQGLVQHPREGMGGIDDDGREDGLQLAAPVAADEGRLLAAQLGDLVEVDLLGGQGRQQLLVPAAVLGGHQLVGLAGDGRQLLLRRQPVGAGARAAALLDLQYAGDADLEELVEDAGHDPEEADPLQEGVALVAGLLHDAAVEVEPGELAVDVVFRPGEIDSHVAPRKQWLRVRDSSDPAETC